MIHRISTHKAWLLAPLAAALAALVGPAPAQTRAASNSSSAGGKAVQAGVHAAFHPGMTDADGHVLPAIPEQRLGEDDGPGMTDKGKADKALAEQHKGPGVHKPGPRVIGESGSKTARPAVSNRWKSAEAPNQASPQASQENDFFGINDTGSEPPDVAMAAGPNQIVAAANAVVDTFDKTGTRMGSQTFSSFFAPVGIPASWFIFDPVVTFDSYINRFWVIATARDDSSNGSMILIALSANQDPSPSGWLFWAVDFTQDGSSHTNNWCDYPHLGYDTRAIYITCNQFSFPSPGSFQYAKVRLMNKSQFLNDTCCSWWDHWNLKEGFLNLSTSFTVQPAVMRHAADSDGEFLVDAQGGGGSGGTLQVWHFPDPIGNPSQLDSASADVSDYSPAPAANQPFGAPGIDTGDARLLFANWQAGHLSTGQNSSCGDLNRSCGAFYELDVSGFSDISTVNDWSLQSDILDYYYPSMDQNNNSDKTMVYSRSWVDSADFAGAWSVAIPKSSTCTSCVGAEVPLEIGHGTYSRIVDGRNRWGDYFSASADPDGLGIWISGEFAQETNNTWATEIGATYNTYQPAVQQSMFAVNFGNQAVGSSVLQVISFTNTGNANLNVSSVTVRGTDFSQNNNCTAGPVEPGFNCLVTVVFTPTAAAARSGTLSVFDNVTGSPHTVSLAGTGVVPTVSVTPASLKFPATGIHLTSTAQTVTVKNTGIVPLTISSITITTGFTETNTCVGIRAPGSSCTVSVKFAPLTVGPQTGTLTIHDNASPATQTVALSGTGSDFAVSVSPSAITVLPGHSGTATITVTPIDSYVGVVNLICAVPAGKSLSCTVNPNSLNTKGSLTSVLTITAGTTTPKGTYQVGVKGATGALNHTATMNVTVK